MERAAIEGIREALAAAREIARELPFDGCDLDDLEDVIAPAQAELEAERPNVQTLATYLNSIARSLRSEPAARSIVKQLDAAMRAAGVPTQWEH
jgi:hypothetical protein